MAKNDLINKDLVDMAAYEIAKKTGLKEKTLADNAVEGFNNAGKAINENWNNATNGAALLPSALAAAADSRNRDAWIRKPTAREFAAYQANKDNPEYQKIVAALENLNRLMAAATIGKEIPEGGGVHHIAGVLFSNGKKLQGADALIAGGGEILSNPLKSMQETWSRVGNAFNSKGDWGKKIIAMLGAVGDSFNEVKKEVIDDRLALMKQDLSNLGFQDNFSGLVVGETGKVAFKEAGLEEYLQKIPKMPDVKLDTNQSNVPTETPPMFISGNSKGVGK
jgi:hypothetical protein